MRDDRPAAESTSQLLAQARSGNQDAVNRLFARHARPLQRWASGRLPKWARQVSDTDDLVQETLFQTFKRIQEFEPRGAGALQAYLRQAILNRIRDFQSGCITLQKIKTGGRQHVIVQYQQVNVGPGGQAVVAGRVRRGARKGRRPKNGR